MVARALVIAAAAVVVCACASTAPNRASLQSPMYMVGDNTASLNAGLGSESDGQFPVIKQIYWFFAGR